MFGISFVVLFSIVVFGRIYGSAAVVSARLGSRSKAHPRCKGRRGKSCRAANRS
jgi:hypothetical protein